MAHNRSHESPGPAAVTGGPPEAAGPDTATLVDLAKAIAARIQSPVEVVERYLERIDRQNPPVNAFVFVAHESAMAQARESEARIAGGRARALEGVPVAVKDDTVVAGMPTSEGSRMVPDTILERDAYLVERLRAAGAVVLGKTNLPEFGSIAVTESLRWGACRNPWDLSRTPGGSSGGSAAAVAAGMAAAAHGDDGGGSLRIPASCCGLFTMKPSRGRLSTAPYGGESPLTVHGYLTRSVLDNAVLHDVTRGRRPGDPYWAPTPAQTFAQEVGGAGAARRLRIAWTATPPIAVAVHPACSQAVRDAALLCADLGHMVEEAAPDWQEAGAQDDFMDVWSVLIGSFVLYLSECGGDISRAEPHNRALFERGRAIPATSYVNTLGRLRRSVRRIVAAWETYDVVLTPTLAQPPLRVGELFQRSEQPLAAMERTFAFTPFTPIVNVTGQPAASFPFATFGGLPIGVQAIGREGDEATLFQLSAQIEEGRPWIDRRPPPL